MTKRQSFLQAYYELTAFGGWKIQDATLGELMLTRQPTKLFDCESEQWIDIPNSSIILRDNRTFSLNGGLDMYSREVLESRKFEKIDT